MKTLIGCLVSCAALVSANAADAQWHTNLEQAQAQARQENKLVFLEFTGSDWCPPCKKLGSEVLRSDAFEAYADQNLVLVELDFPHQKPQSEEQKEANKALAREYNVQGFPTVIVLKPDGKELHREIGYGGQSATEYVAELKKAVGR